MFIMFIMGLIDVNFFICVILYIDWSFFIGC